MKNDTLQNLNNMVWDYVNLKKLLIPVNLQATCYKEKLTQLKEDIVRQVEYGETVKTKDWAISNKNGVLSLQKI